MASPPKEARAVAEDPFIPDLGLVPSGEHGMDKRDKLAVDYEDKGEVEVPMSAMASLSPSLYEHVEENGRTYHKYKEGKYYLPNDEVSRTITYQACYFVLTNSSNFSQSKRDLIALYERLHLAPLKEDNVKHALDIGTGTGIWAIEFAEQFPQAKVIGTDLSPIQPEFVPPNLSFEVDDVDDDWVYTHPFDYIHGRLMVFGFLDPLAVFRKAFNALSPGGYFEMQDLCSPIRSFDHSLDGSAMIRTSNLIIEACQKRGIDLTVPKRYKEMMQSVGFVDVKEVIVEWPIGTWAKSEFHKRIGAWFKKDMEVGAEGIIMGLFTRLLGMSKEDVMIIVEDVKKEMNDSSIHAYEPFYVVYGKKPE
ncbi:putative methyltransferase [Lachnellula hyalina]|uniref:Putative methyltransferase n=1 Tax=Lachnellula hyalina TaxID=1316788 RepID=A0A8H8QSZ4_9HELO|nr:putative methyltransferase [Lachnellula hyalina]TVY22184.1 putative methyltransferase [Lachnellula hyalina]